MSDSDFPKPSSDIALKAFNSGFNCAQSVVKVYTEALDFDENEAVNKAAGLGGGRYRGICGAVSGAYLVLEMFCSHNLEQKDQKRCVENLTKAFNQQFQQMHSTNQCKELLKNEVDQPKNSYHSICERCIIDAIELLNGIFEKEHLISGGRSGSI